MNIKIVFLSGYQNNFIMSLDSVKSNRTVTCFVFKVSSLKYH